MTTYNIYLPKALEMSDDEIAKFYSENPDILVESFNKVTESLKKMVMLQLEQVQAIDYNKILEDTDKKINDLLKLQVSYFQSIDYNYILEPITKSIDNLLKLQIEQFNNIDYKGIIESSMEKKLEQISFLTQVVEPMYTTEEMEETKESFYGVIESIMREIDDSKETKKEKENKKHLTFNFLISKSISALFFAFSNTGLSPQGLMAIFMLLSIWEYTLISNKDKSNLEDEKEIK